MKKTKRNRLFVIIVCFLMLLFLVSFTFAWFAGLRYNIVGGGENPIGTLATLRNKVDVEGYGADGNKLTDFLTDNEYESYNNQEENNWVVEHLITDDLFTPGAINKLNRVGLNLSNEDFQTRINDVIEANTKTKYFKVTNRSNLDIMVKTEFGIGITDSNVLTSFWYLITDVTTAVSNVNEITENKLRVYATNNIASRNNSFNENNIETKTFDNLDNRIQLGQINEANDQTGNTKYFRIDYGLTESALRASGTSYYNKNIGLDIYIFYGQVNAPDEGDIVSYDSVKFVRTAEQLMNLLDNVNLAYPGDKIKFLDNIEVDSSVLINRPLNFDLNGYDLIVRGDLTIRYETAYNATIDLTKTSSLDVVGDINLSIPNAGLSIYGDNEKAAGVNAFDIRLTGLIYNGVGHNNSGLLLSNTYIIYRWQNPTTYVYSNRLPIIEMDAKSLLTVGENVEIGTIQTSEVSGVYVNNYGSIEWINLVSMVLPNIQGLQIRIYNDGVLGKIDNNYVNAITLPASSTISNTQVIKGIHSNTFTINGSRNYTNSNITIEGQITDYVTKIENETNTYRVYLDLSIVVNSNVSKLQTVLEQYFATNPDLIKQIEKLIIVSTTDTYLNNNDFNYLRSDELRDLKYLDLANSSVMDTTYIIAQERHNRIPEAALVGKTSLLNVILPNSIKYISQRAFANTSLTTITIPSSTDKIGTNAFNTVREVVINKFYPISNNNDFLNAFSPTAYYLVDEVAIDNFKVKFEEKNPQIANKVYCNATLVGSHYIRMLANNTIEIVAFTGDINDIDITPRTFEYLGSTYLVSSIGRDAYVNATNTQAVTVHLIIGEGTNYIGKKAFYSLPSIQAVTITGAVEIDESAFYGCTYLKTLVITGNGALNKQAFSRCSSLETINLTNIESINDEVFSNCTSIRILSIPSVTYLGNNVFMNCSSFERVILGGIESVKSGTFNNCTSLHTVELNERTKIIEARAFIDCVSLENINLSYIEEIGDNSFQNCRTINNIVSDSIISIGNSAFLGCSNLEYIKITNLETIGVEAFNNIQSLIAVEIPNVISIGARAFRRCMQLKYVELEQVETIGNEAFSYCSGLLMVSFGCNPTIDNNAFLYTFPRYIDFSKYDLSSINLSNYEELSENPFGGSDLWHNFTSSTKYYFAGGETSEITEVRKNYLYNILANSYQNDANLMIDSIFEKNVFAGEEIVETSDYDGEKGIRKNLGLYCINPTTNTLIAYHGPVLRGNVILPFNNYIENGFDTLGDLTIPTNEQLTEATSGVTISDAYSGNLTYIDGNGIEQTVNITSIGKGAFIGVNCEVMTVNGETIYTHVRFASSITVINENAFRYSGINFLYCNNVTEIKENAFRNITSLRFVDLESVTTIRAYAFSCLMNGYDVYDSDNYLTIDYGNLTKVIFRYVNTIEVGAFIVTRTYDYAQLIILDFSENINANGVVGRPLNFSTHWRGMPTTTTYNRDLILLIPYITDNAGNINSSKIEEIRTSFREVISTAHIHVKYPYEYNSGYKVRGVEVGMFLLEPAYAGNVIQGFIIKKCLIRYLGNIETDFTTLSDDGKKVTLTVPAYLNSNMIETTDERLIANHNYPCQLISYSYANMDPISGKTVDVTFSDEVLSIPSNCFDESSITNVNLNNVEVIGAAAFGDCGRINYIIANKLRRIEASAFYETGVNVIDLRNNKENNGNTIYTVMSSGMFGIGQMDCKIYVNEEDYDTYVSMTKNVYIGIREYSSALITDLELYLCIQVPGMYVGVVDLMNSSSMDLSSVVVPIANEGEEIVWSSVDDEGNVSEEVFVNDGIISVAYTEITYQGQTTRTYLLEGHSYVSCTKIRTNGTTELLGKFKVNIITGESSMSCYNLLTIERTNVFEEIERGFKIIRYIGKSISGIFNPSDHLDQILNAVMSQEELDLYFNVPDNRVFEIGVAAYLKLVIPADTLLYLVTDEITKIDDYAFYQVPFYQIWLMNVVTVGRKAFVNGSTTDEMEVAVMPKVREIQAEAFSSNSTLRNVVIGENNSTELTTIGNQAFYNNYYLEKFSTVSSNISYLYNCVTNRTQRNLINEYVGIDYREFQYLKEDNSFFDGTNMVYDYQYMDSSDYYIYIPDRVTVVGDYAFSDLNYIKNVKLPINDTYNKIGNYTFANDKNLVSVIGIDRIETIGAFAFSECTNLPTYNDIVGIDLRNIKVIENSAFLNNYSLTEVYFNNITTIGALAFSGCINFRYGHFENNNITEKATIALTWNNSTHELARYYVSVDNQQYFIDIPNTYVKEIVTTYNGEEIIAAYEYNEDNQIIGLRLVCYNGNEMIQIPESLEVDSINWPIIRIGSYAFKGLKYNLADSSTSNIILPLSVKMVDDYAFAKCSFIHYQESFNELSITTVSYGNYVFYDNKTLTEIVYRRMALGGAYAYSNCQSLTKIYLDENYNEANIYTAPIIDENHFTNCKPGVRCYIKVGEIDLFSSIGYSGWVFETALECGDYLIRYINNNTEVVIVKYNLTNITDNYTIPTELNGIRVTTIGTSAYSNIIVSNSNLIIHNGITKIERYAFYNCDFREIDIEGNNVIIEDYAFSSNIVLREIDLTGVTSLGEGVFQNNIKLNTVTLFSNCISIPDYCFDGCTNLNEINLGNIEQIGKYAFRNCTSLSIMYGHGDSLETDYIKFGTVFIIGDYAFQNCTAIKNINFKSVNNVGKYAFYGCNMLVNTTKIMNNPLLGEGIFYQCTSLNSFDFDTYSALVSVPDYAFYGCTNLTTVNLLNASNIGNSAFSGCNRLEEIVLRNANTIGLSSFSGCTALSLVSLGRVMTIGANAFTNCISLTNIDFKLTETINSGAFMNCNITGVLDLKNVRSIGNSVFTNNSLITEVIFHQMQNISNNCFENDIYIETFDFSENYQLNGGEMIYTAPNNIASNAFVNVNDSFIIYIPVDASSSLINNYSLRTENKYNDRIYEKGRISSENNEYMVKDYQGGLELIRYLGSELPASYTVPTTLDGKNVISVGRYCYSLASKTSTNSNNLNLGLNIIKIKDFAFYNCQFENVSMPNVEEIGNSAFYGNGKIVYLSLPNVRIIGNNAFANNYRLQIVRGYNTLESIGENAFYLCEELRSVYLENTTPPTAYQYCFGELDQSNVIIKVPQASINLYKEANNYSYYRDRIQSGEINDADFSYREVDNGNSIEIIAYEGQATSINIPDKINNKNVVKILDYAFCNSVNLEIVSIPSSIESISSSAFLNNYSIKSINVVANDVVNFMSIDGVLFKCENNNPTILIKYPVAKSGNTYRINSNVSIIYENAFYGNTYLERIEVPASVRYIGESAFVSCPSLIRVTFVAIGSGIMIVPILYGTNIFDTNNSNLKIYVPQIVLNDFQTNVYFKYYKDRIYGN